MSKSADCEGLRTKWSEFADTLGKEWLPGGVTYHGASAHKAWVAFVIDPDTLVAGPEGWGDDPIAAIDELAASLADTRRDT